MTMIYVIYDDHHKRVKIGYSAEIQKRFSQIQTANSVDLELMFAFIGGRDDEFQLHTVLAPYKVRGEWFTWNKEVFEILFNYSKRRLGEMGFCELSKNTHIAGVQIIGKIIKSINKKRITLKEIQKYLTEGSITRKEIKEILKQLGWEERKYNSGNVYFTKG